jgi:hypothetical protein
MIGPSELAEKFHAVMFVNAVLWDNFSGLPALTNGEFDCSLS